jgi:hypothetical protein
MANRGIEGLGFRLAIFSEQLLVGRATNAKRTFG